MRWTTSELQYLELHACEGAEAIAKALGRTTESVRQQAKQYGISLRRRWTCPRCGTMSFRPLSTRTGWCSVCTKRERRHAMERQLQDMREEIAADREENRLRQALYSRRHDMRKNRNESHMNDNPTPDQGEQQKQGGVECES